MANSRPVCPKSELCGGCTYQGMEYSTQLDSKLDIVKQALIKNELDPGLAQSMLPSPDVYSYRNKMEYSFGDEVIGGELNLGMHKKGSYISIIDAGVCQIVPDDFNLVLNAVKAWCIEKQYTFYHRKRHDGLLRSLIIRHGVRSNELLVNIVTTSLSDFDEEGFKELILSLKTENQIIGIIHTINDNVADALVVDEERVLYGRDWYMDKILGLDFKVGYLSFFQSNVLAAERLYQYALDHLPDIEGKTVYDLYCGTGTITQAMALKARMVYGVEINEDAVNSAIANTKINGLSNCRFICGDVLKVLDDIEEKPDVIVVDPPRAGIHPKAMKKICSYGIPEILYISCSPRSLAVNLAQAKEYGYETSSMQCFDNFAFTEHVELICLLTKKEEENSRLCYMR